jgi:hypothetical protein
MTTENITVIDYIDNTTVKGKPFDEPSNEYFALVCLKDGLNHLYDFAKQCDEMCLSQLNPKNTYFLYGNNPEVKNIPYPMLTCAFQWYAVTACQYVETVGKIAFNQDNTRPGPKMYLNSVIPEVKIYRDKVAAHFAWLTKNENDSEAERLASILPQVSFYNDSFYVGALKVTLSIKSKTTTSNEIQPWSIVKIHDTLTARYWRESNA